MPSSSQNVGAGFAILLLPCLMFGHGARACGLPGLPLPASLGSANVILDTEAGEIEIAVDLRQAPRTACNFLKYVAAQAYSGGNFGRTVRADNQAHNPVPIAVVQAYPNPGFTVFTPIELERTRDSGLHHLDGTVSMARKGPDDATAKFFICIGDQPELDFGGRRNPDGQGFAAFGRLVRGMEVVRQIQSGPADGEQLSPPVLIRHALLVVP